MSEEASPVVVAEDVSSDIVVEDSLSTMPTASSVLVAKNSMVEAEEAPSVITIVESENLLIPTDVNNILAQDFLQVSSVSSIIITVCIR